jgi:glycosyltransferase involved in cell wall biosynthesis
MNRNTEKPLSFFVVNFDWRDLFRTGRGEFTEKLNRDQLRPDLNHFFFFSWGREHYTVRGDGWQTVHTRTFFLHKLRPILNLWAMMLIPYTAWRYRLRPDVWLVYDFGMVPACWIAKKMFGGRLIMLLNNQPVLYSRVRRFGWLKGWYSYVTERMTVHLVEHFFTLNETMRAYLADLGVPREQTTLFTVNTIERDTPLIAAAHPGVIRAQYGIRPDQKVLVAVARLEAEKNYPLLLDLFAKLPTEYVLFCLGEGSFRPDLEAKVKELGISDRLFLPGNIERADIWNYYKDADAFVLLSKVEALGIVFWEAMYVHVPVLGAAVPGIMESLGEDGDRGRVWTESDGPAGFAERIHFCTTDSPARAVMIQRAKAFVDDKIQNRVTFNDFIALKNNSVDQHTS